MPIPSNPFTLQCKTCGWKKTFAPVTDVVMPNIPSKCPECNHDELTKKIHSRYSFAFLFGEKC